MNSNYMAPLIVASCYECLITMTPDDYVNVKPGLATSWQRTPDGNGWRFTLRDGVKFPSGNVMTADDVKYSLDRVLYSAINHRSICQMSYASTRSTTRQSM